MEKISLQIKFTGKPDLPMNAIECEIGVKNSTSVPLVPKSKKKKKRYAFWKSAAYFDLRYYSLKLHIR